MAQLERTGVTFDRALNFFSEEEAAYFRDLVKDEWTKQRRVVTMFPDRLEDEQGVTYGLWNLAADCHRHPQRLWPRIVADQVKVLMFDPNADFFEGMSRPQVLRNTFLRLQAAANLPDPDWYPYAREVAPGILELIALHRRRATMFMRECDVERFGGRDLLRETGLANLRALPLEQRELIETPEGGHFRVLQGQSSFTASRLLTLDHLVEQLFSDPAMPKGVLAAIPNRDEVAVHVIRDTSVVPTLANLTTFAHMRIASAPGPLSPNVFWLHRDRFEQVTECDGEGVRFRFSPAFKAMMEPIFAQAGSAPEWAPAGAGDH
ncbi:MAG: hypothetical protein NVSMB32_10170 [Actinomycetota bacterium]